MIKNNNFFNLLFLIIIVISSSNIYSQDKRDSLTSVLLISEFKKHPKMDIQDFYKLLHQSNLGSEHAVKNKEAVVSWMKEEINMLDWSKEDNLIDTISLDASIVRINLRPLIKLGYSSQKLIDAFIKTANNYNGSKDNLKTDLEVFKRLVKNKFLPFDNIKLINFINEMKKQNYPAVHHSNTYVKEYAPAYRVIAAEYLQQLFTTN